MALIICHYYEYLYQLKSFENPKENYLTLGKYPHFSYIIIALVAYTLIFA